jgi:methyl-accepting chemotaxis protein
VHLPEFIRSTTFRWALAVAGAFGVCTLLLFGFVYWQTATYVTANLDVVITAAARQDTDTTREQELKLVMDRLQDDPRRVKLAELFGPNGGTIAGNIEAMPTGLVIDNLPHTSLVVRVDNRGREVQTARVIARRMSSGDVLLIGHDAGDLREVGQVVARALALGLLPALCLALLTGTWLSRRAQQRINEMNRRVQLVVAGKLKERLPIGDYDDPLNRLARIVNGMLDQIELLVSELAR